MAAFFIHKFNNKKMKRRKSYYTSIDLPTTVGSTNLLALPTIANKNILAIQVLLGDNVVKTSDGKAVVSIGDSKNLHLVLRDNNSDVFNKVPLVAFDPTKNNGNLFEVNGTLQFEQCSVIAGLAITASTLPLIIYYED